MQSGGGSSPRPAASPPPRSSRRPRATTRSRPRSAGGRSGGNVPRRCHVRRPEARRHDAVDAAADVEGAGSVRSRSRTTAASARWSPEDVPTNAAEDFAVKVAVKGLDPHERYYYRFFTPRSRPVGRFRPRPRPTPTRPFTSRSGPARTTPSATTTPTRAGQGRSRLHPQPRGLHLRGRAALRSAPRRVRAATSRVDGRQARTLNEYRDSVPALPHRQEPAEDAGGAVRHDLDAGTTTRSQNDYSAAPEPGGRHRRPLHAAAAHNAYRAFFEQMPTFSPTGARSCTTRPRFGTHLGPVRAGRAPVPRSEPLRRPGGALTRAPRLDRPAHDAGRTPQLAS